MQWLSQGLPGDQNEEDNDNLRKHLEMQEEKTEEMFLSCPPGSERLATVLSICILHILLIYWYWFISEVFFCFVFVFVILASRPFDQFHVRSYRPIICTNLNPNKTVNINKSFMLIQLTQVPLIQKIFYFKWH